MFLENHDLQVIVEGFGARNSVKEPKKQSHRTGYALCYLGRLEVESSEFMWHLVIDLLHIV